MKEYMEKFFGWKTVMQKPRLLDVPALMERGEYRDVVFFRDPDLGIRKFSNVPYVIGTLADKGNGYEWGYGGTGPTDFAANILMHFADHDEAVARAFHIEFRNRFLVNMAKAGGRIPKEDIFSFLETMKTAQPDLLEQVRADMFAALRSR